MLLPQSPLVLDAAGDQFPHKLWVTEEAYRPDSIMDGGDFAELVVRAVSLRGRYKRETGGPRQDDFCIRANATAPALVIAVADGLGSAEHSHVGASLAVRQAAAVVLKQIASTPDGEHVSLDWSAVFAHAAWSLVDEQARVTQDAEAAPSGALENLASTLSVAVLFRVRNTWLVETASVGDSPILLLHEGQLEELSFRKDEGALADNNVGAALPQVPEVAPVRQELQSGDVLFVSTDGWSNPATVRPSKAGDAPAVRRTTIAGRRFLEALDPIPDLIQFAYLTDFSQISYDDDRTLVSVWVP